SNTRASGRRVARQRRWPVRTERPQQTRPELRDETQPASPKRGAHHLENPFGWTCRDLSGLELSEPTLGFGNPEPLHIGIPSLAEAGDQALGKASALPTRELQSLGFEIARLSNHSGRLARRLLKRRLNGPPSRRDVLHWVPNAHGHPVQ